MTVTISSLVVQDISNDELDTRVSNAINVLEVGGVHAKGAALAFGSWYEFRQAPRTNVEEKGLRLATVGEGYKNTRRLTALIGARLHTVTMVGGMTRSEGLRQRFAKAAFFWNLLRRFVDSSGSQRHREVGPFVN